MQVSAEIEDTMQKNVLSTKNALKVNLYIFCRSHDNKQWNGVVAASVTFFYSPSLSPPRLSSSLLPNPPPSRQSFAPLHSARRQRKGTEQQVR